MKIFNSLSVFVFFVLLSISASAQQDPNFTLYKYNMNIINPAYAGSRDFASINMAYKSQWVGVKDAPETQTVSYSSPTKSNVGLGFSVINDCVSIIRETDVDLDVSYKLKLDFEYYLYFGIKAGVGFVNLDYTNAGAVDEDIMFAENESYLRPHFGTGFYLKHPKYYLSISTPNLLNGHRYVKNASSEVSILKDLHVYAGGGYTHELKSRLYLRSELMTRYVKGAPMSFDVASTLSMYGKAEAGVNYRYKESVSVYSLFRMSNDFQFGFSYEMMVNTVGNAFKNPSLEFILKHQFNKKNKYKVLFCF